MLAGFLLFLPVDLLAFLRAESADLPRFESGLPRLESGLVAFEAFRGGVPDLRGGVPPPWEP